MTKSILFIINILLVISCGRTRYTKCHFVELDKLIRDSAIIISRKVLNNDYHASSLIDFSGRCKFTERTFGPWITGIEIRDTVSNKKVSLPYNAPVPYIVYDNCVYFPEEYNLYVVGFENNPIFNKLTMK